MRLRDRGMVKWAPYKSLPEQEDYLEKMEEEKNKVDKPLLSDDELIELDTKLSTYNRGDHISIEYYDYGFIKTIDDYLDYIDTINKRIVLKNRMSIPVSNVLSLN